MRKNSLSLTIAAKKSIFIRIWIIYSGTLWSLYRYIINIIVKFTWSNSVLSYSSVRVVLIRSIRVLTNECTLFLLLQLRVSDSNLLSLRWRRVLTITIHNEEGEIRSRASGVSNRFSSMKKLWTAQRDDPTPIYRKIMRLLHKSGKYIIQAITGNWSRKDSSNIFNSRYNAR